MACCTGGLKCAHEIVPSGGFKFCDGFCSGIFVLAGYTHKQVPIEEGYIAVTDGIIELSTDVGCFAALFEKCTHAAFSEPIFLQAFHQLSSRLQVRVAHQA